MENSTKSENGKCDHCKTTPGFVTEGLAGDLVFVALECDCGKRTSFKRSRSTVIEEWESSTYKLSKEEEAKKVEGLCPTNNNFKT